MNNCCMECGCGKGFGGFLLINGMCYICGNVMDLDNWVKELGLEYWSYFDCLFYYWKVEICDIGFNDYYGGDGLVSVMMLKLGNNLFFEVMVEVGVQVGYLCIDDFNGYQQEGFGLMDCIVMLQGCCVSIVCGYFDQVCGCLNLIICIYVLIDYIIFVGKCVVGVEWLEGESMILLKVMVNKEVLLCVGVIVLLQILQCFGVGNLELFRQFDILVVYDFFGVGENLQDYLEMYLQYECKELVLFYLVLQWWNQLKIGVEWLFGGIGIGVSNQFEVGGFICSCVEFVWLNIQYYFLLVVINYNGFNVVKEYGFQCYVGLMCLFSCGYVCLKLCDLYVYLVILFNYMFYEQDWQEFCDVICIIWEIMNQLVLDKYCGCEISLGIECQSDVELDEFVCNYVEIVFYLCGICKMGYDEMVVVDGEGCVYGLEGLWVVDVLIMLQIIIGNFNVIIIMIGEKMVDVICGCQLLLCSIVMYYVVGDVLVCC